MASFGWSLPAGCGTLPGEEDAGPCSVCGYSVDNDDCICPECAVCGATGDPACYESHGLVRSWHQRLGFALLTLELYLEARWEDEVLPGLIEELDREFEFEFEFGLEGEGS